MAVKIRLSRGGMKKAPHYRIVVQDERMPRDGRFIESIGRYDPTQTPSLVEVDEDKAKEWMGKGAKATRTVQDLLVKAGIET